MIGEMESEQSFFLHGYKLFTCVGTYVFGYRWKSEVDVCSLSQQPSALFTEARSLTEPGALRLV